MWKNTGKNEVSWLKVNLEKMLTEPEIQMVGLPHSWCGWSFHKSHVQEQHKHREFPIKIKVVNLFC